MLLLLDLNLTWRICEVALLERLPLRWDLFIMSDDDPFTYLYTTLAEEFLPI